MTKSTHSNKFEGLRSKKLLRLSEDIRNSKNGICSITIHAYFQDGAYKEFEYRFEYQDLKDLHIEDISTECHKEVVSKIDIESVLLIHRTIKYKDAANEKWKDSAFKFAPSLKTDIGKIYVLSL